MIGENPSSTDTMMTVALLIALAGSLGLMAWIVRRLEKAS